MEIHGSQVLANIYLMKIVVFLYLKALTVRDIGLVNESQIYISGFPEVWVPKLLFLRLFLGPAQGMPLNSYS